MIKYTSLLLFLLAISNVPRHIQAQELAVWRIRYESAPGDPLCEIEENNPEVECTEDGSTVNETVLEPENSAFDKFFFELKKMEFSGDCDCVLTIYSGNSMKGCYVKEAVITDSYESVNVQDIWKRPGYPQSFTVICNL